MDDFQNFSIWLATQTHRNDPVGDLARDFVSDNRRRMNRGEPTPQSVEEIRSAIRRAGGGTVVRKALDKAIAEYQSGK